MGSMLLSGFTSSSINIGFLAASINPVAAFIFGIIVLVIIIAGFLVVKYKKNTDIYDIYDEELANEAYKGIAKKKLDI